MGRVASSFLLVGVLALTSHWHAAKLPMYTSSVDTAPVNTEEMMISPPLGNSSVVESPGSARYIPRVTSKTSTLDAISEQVTWLNSLVKPLVPSRIWDALPRFAQCWLRNWVFAIIVYFGLGFTWAYYIYQCFGNELFPKANVPDWADMAEQMNVSFWALPLYSLLPSITEELCERGYTLAYGRVSDVGLPKLLMYLYIYMAFVEFGVYWMHRSLHDIPAGYKYLHAVHHKYNKEHTMSPFAGLAFHPIDGILQALPYALALLFVPMHFLTHEVLLFATAFWTANIHDNIHANLVPIMGAGWHTIHHTSYKHNYGHYFVFMDWLFGTLISPEEFSALTKSRRGVTTESSAIAAA